jgi:ATP-dependent helicase/nuclease subunit A
VDQPSPRPLTDQQGRAISCRDVSVVLSSGAGCGKTHVLTQRYLSHLREGAEVGQIVAITFTDRAARQMRERIRHGLHTLLHAAPDDEVERWTAHLRALETAQICTIHAFCGTLLRQHAVEAGIDPGFDVLEDVLSVNLETEALTTALQRLLTAQSEPGEALRQLVLLYGWKPVNEALQQLLGAWDDLAWRSWTDDSPERITAAWQHYARAELLPRYLSYLLAAAPKIAGCLDLLWRKPPLPGSKMAESVAVLLDELPRLAAAPDLAAAVERLTEAAKVGRHGVKAWADAEDYQAIKAALEDFREELRGQRLESFAVVGEDVTAAVATGQRFLRVAGEVIRAYRDLKQQHGVVDFQDLLVRARDLLRDQPAVRARLQERYSFLLIDELQDTDPVQMQLVEYLCGGGLTAGKLFAVGDHSQSIYRFRGANVRLFRDLRGQVPHEGRLGLTLNFRSQPALLHFTNALLGDHLVDYEPLRAHRTQLNPHPCVEFLWTPKSDGDNATAARSNEAEAIARRFALMIGNEALVTERTAEGERLRPARRGDIVLLFRSMSNVHLYEAALRRHGLDYYLVGGRAFFAQQEIYDLLNLLRTLENPQDGLSLAGALRSPFCCLSDEALFVLSRQERRTALPSRPDGSPEPSYETNTTDGGTSRQRDGLWAGLHDEELLRRLPEDQRATVERARRFLDRWRGLKDRLPIAGLLNVVIGEAGYDASTQLEFLGDRKLANLWKLVDLARTFDRTGLFGLAEFIQRLGDLVQAQPREEQAATQPENADVIRLMTIHQAKGLEFPVVVVPDLAAVGRDRRESVARWDARLGCVVRPPADEEPAPFPDFGWRLWQAAETIEDWHEDLRTLYVACTRAEDYLLLSASLEQPLRPANTWMQILAGRFDLDSGECLVKEAADERPRVRVHDASELESRKGAHQPLADVLEREERRQGAARIAPVVLRVRGQRVFTVAAVEHFRRIAAPFHEPLRSTAIAWQFDAEDSTDGNDWLAPWQCLAVGELEMTRAEVVARQVLERWDPREANGWQALLAAFAGKEPDAGAMLARFAASAVCGTLAAARSCTWHVEFLVDWPPEGMAAAERVGVRGLFDCLWQGPRGDWHLLALTQGGANATGWQEQAPGLTVGAWAVQRCHGVWPQSLTLYCLESGVVFTVRGKELQRRRPLVAFNTALRQLAEAILVE